MTAFCAQQTAGLDVKRPFAAAGNLFGNQGESLSVVTPPTPPTPSRSWSSLEPANWSFVGESRS